MFDGWKLVFANISQAAVIPACLIHLMSSVFLPELVADNVAISLCFVSITHPTTKLRVRVFLT